MTEKWIPIKEATMRWMTPWKDIWEKKKSSDGAEFEWFELANIRVNCKNLNESDGLGYGYCVNGRLEYIDKENFDSIYEVSFPDVWRDESEINGELTPDELKSRGYYEGSSKLTPYEKEVGMIEEKYYHAYAVPAKWREKEETVYVNELAFEEALLEAKENAKMSTSFYEEMKVLWNKYKTEEDNLFGDGIVLGIKPFLQAVRCPCCGERVHLVCRGDDVEVKCNDYLKDPDQGRCAWRRTL
jgi:hypothetical protein